MGWHRSEHREHVPPCAHHLPGMAPTHLWVPGVPRHGPLRSWVARGDLVVTGSAEVAEL